MPVEVITIPNCEDSEQLLNSLKDGCTAEITAVRTILQHVYQKVNILVSFARNMIWNKMVQR